MKILRKLRENMENRGRKPKASVTFYMRCNGFGDIKIMFSYSGRKYTGGSTYLTLFREEFDLLKPNGEPKDMGCERNPRLINGIYVHELLGVIRNTIEERVNDDLAYGRELSEEYLKGLMGEACDRMFAKLGEWSSNIEWNRRISKALREGRPCDFNLFTDVREIGEGAGEHGERGERGEHGESEGAGCEHAKAGGK